MPHLSVIIPTFNASRYVETTMRSVLNQTFRDLEVIVVDDCSTDSTLDIVEQLAKEDNRVRFVRMPKNFGGPAGPRNKGVAESAADWIALVDADDIWHPAKISSQFNAIEKTGCTFSCTLMHDFADGTEPALNDVTTDKLAFITFPMQKRKSRIPTSTVLVRRDLLLRHRFNESPAYRAVEDHDCWLRCVEDAGRCVKVMSPLMGYRISGNQISKGKLRQLKRHFHVMSNYVEKSGRRIGNRAAVYTLTHIVLSIYYRVILRQL
jgi:teichuronic acid biosynthesis glycosyltransferase TuaG